ncbi:MAG: T9SS type A sorting domain-containing protein [Candidatus Aegiribacteria sp.]|nr:T9SS type A sorting domain-containing protein [Candidatus Aegiribacteria sp.]
MLYLCLLLLISSVDIEYPDSSAAWPLGYFAPLRRGYGQWNVTDDFHRALDFHGSVYNLVSAPYPGDDFWVIDKYIVTDTITETRAEGHVIIGNDLNADYGWLYGHININHKRFPLDPEVPYSRSVISELVQHSLGSHVHFSWLDVGALSPGVPQHGYFNPIDYLIRCWSLFNVAAFGPLNSYGVFGLKGVVFFPDDSPFPSADQNNIREVVDIVVRPYTYYYQNPTNDACGVRIVNWRLAWQNPSTLEYQRYNTSFLGRWRTLYDFSGYIYDDADPTIPISEYEKIYFDTDHWQNYLCLTNTCETPRSDSSFSGVATVWIDSYNRQNDFNDGEYCRGGWDTRLASGFAFDGDPAYVDEAAAFIDGRYAIDVIAIPQRFDNKTFRRLPVNDITLPEPEVTGIIVDNWAPRIYEICIKDNPSEIIRDRYYQINEPNNPYEGRMYGYYPQDSWAYIGTGTGTNEYSLEIWYSEPVTVTQNISLTIKMVIGPDSSVNWQDEISFALDESCLNPAGECEYALYTASGARPSGYVGNQIVELAIDSSFATDLAGNGLDADATTIVPALGGGSIINYEPTFTWIEPHVPVSGYYREVSDQDSRSNTLWANYDAISTFPYYLEHTITLVGPLTTAELFHEVGPQSYSRCDIYGGTWMCDVQDDVLHVYIVDYLGNIRQNAIVFDYAAIDASGELFSALITAITYPPENPWENPTCDFDRFGWLAWRKIIPPPEDGSIIRDEVYVQNIELHVSVYDSYGSGSSSDFLVFAGHTWYDSLSMQWCETDFRSISDVWPGDDGRIRVKTREYLYPNTTPILNTYYLTPPGTRVLNNIDSDNVRLTGIASLDIEIDDYFTVFPNPVRGSLSIEFMTSEAVGSTVHIYDISGHLVNTIAEELPGMRNHNLIWNLKDTSGHIIPTGIYYVSLVSGSFTETRTVIVIH